MWPLLLNTYCNLALQSKYICFWINLLNLQWHEYSKFNTCIGLKTTKPPPCISAPIVLTPKGASPNSPNSCFIFSFEIFSDENKFNNSCIADLHNARWPWCTPFIEGFQVVPRTQPAVPWLWEISTRQNKQNTFLNGRCTLWVLTIKHRWSI